MSVDVTCETTIRRSLTDVWRATTDPANDTRWTTGLVDVVARQPGPLVLGAEVERTSQFLGRRMVYVIAVTSVSALEFVEMTTTNAPFPIRVRYGYSAVPEGTRFTIHTTGEPGGFYALAAPLVSASVRRSITNDLATLKEWLESDVGGAP